MRTIAKLATSSVALAAFLAGCHSGSGTLGGKAGALTCAVGTQKQAVADLMQEWYLFNDEPDQQQKYATLDPDQYATADELLSALRYRPDRYDRNFSFLTTREADTQFFGEGQFVGFGFGSKFADAPLDSDLRLTQVFAGSPADAAGLARGQRMLTIDGRTIAEISQAEGLDAAFGPSEVGVSRTFRMRRLDGSEFEATVVKDVVTIDPVPAARTFATATGTVGYLDFRTFVSTADAELDQAFADFDAAGVNALIVDLRYNGGGLVATAERLADLIAGFIAKGQVQSRTLFNSAKSALDAETLFQERPSSLPLLLQVVFITTGSSASASELVINALAPHTVVRLVGAQTFGKPVGQSALSFCGGERLLRAVTFRTVNSVGYGGYYDGLPVDCPASDDLARAIGDPLEASLASALTLVSTGSCPAAPGAPKPLAPLAALTDPPWAVTSPSAQRNAGAF